MSVTLGWGSLASSGTLLPHEIRIHTDPIRWMSENSGYVDECLLRYGMVRFPCNSIDTADRFSRLLRQYEGHDFFDGGMSAAPRRRLAEGVFTANEAPSWSVIPFHHEMAQCDESPEIVAFACARPAQEGGATSIADSALVASYMRRHHPSVSRMLQERGVRYNRRLQKEDETSSATGRSWVTTFGTDDRSRVESSLHNTGHRLTWCPDGSLVVASPVRKVFRTVNTPSGEHEVFFNSIVAATFGWEDLLMEDGCALRSCTFGDDGDFDVHTLDALCKCKSYIESIKIPLSWKQGEFVLLNNTRVMHSRESFVGPRTVMASLLT